MSNILILIAATPFFLFNYLCIFSVVELEPLLELQVSSSLSTETKHNKQFHSEWSACRTITSPATLELICFWTMRKSSGEAGCNSATLCVINHVHTPPLSITNYVQDGNLDAQFSVPESCSVFPVRTASLDTLWTNCTYTLTSQLLRRARPLPDKDSSRS